MTESAPPESRQTEPSPPGGGFRLRLFLVIAAPALLLGLGGAYLALSLAPEPGAPLPVEAFLSAYLSAAALAVALAGVLAYAADFALKRRLHRIERGLRSGRGRDPAATASEWLGLRSLSRAAEEAVTRTEDRAQDAEELKALQRAADDLLERIRIWAETEIPPSFDPSGPLSEHGSALQILAGHLEEKLQEARDVAELARQSMGEACEGIERAGRESGRSAREIASLLTAIAEVRRLTGELAAGATEAARVEAPKPVAPTPPRLPSAALTAALERAFALGQRLESLERLALRAALELAAEGISERREAGPWLDRVETLRHVALGARAVREESETIAQELSRAAAEEAKAPMPAAVAAEPAQPATLSPAWAAMIERLTQWGNDAHSRSERLAALAQRLSGEVSTALGAARASSDELAGLSARFEARGGGGDEAARAAHGGDVPAWPAGSRPLRLLTRDDVVPEDDEGASGRGDPVRE